MFETDKDAQEILLTYFHLLKFLRIKNICFDGMDLWWSVPPPPFVRLIWAVLVQKQSVLDSTHTPHTAVPPPNNSPAALEYPQHFICYAYTVYFSRSTSCPTSEADGLKPLATSRQMAYCALVEKQQTAASTALSSAPGPSPMTFLTTPTGPDFQINTPVVIKRRRELRPCGAARAGTASTDIVWFVPLDRIEFVMKATIFKSFCNRHNAAMAQASISPPTRVPPWPAPSPARPPSRVPLLQPCVVHRVVRRAGFGTNVSMKPELLLAVDAC
ncbi:uncharacterized protein B0H18DRAFT_1124549 [Fomitopsis serialis]|uniref:uncharacterized protein n=1 Tax=Fomitopsis serialis TaxID=139415 RepID=UPI002008BAAA|nr:uncharacterized protein B0H18DRAFT_1124549 [Neoantrodia serialis]KAH9916008.1 hypothetical protein B0H18DRAFT_1124549 [Neoantrodia serialis]